MLQINKQIYFSYQLNNRQQQRILYLKFEQPIMAKQPKQSLYETFSKQLKPVNTTLTNLKPSSTANSRPATSKALQSTNKQSAPLKTNEDVAKKQQARSPVRQIAKAQENYEERPIPKALQKRNDPIKIQDQFDEQPLPAQKPNFDAGLQININRQFQNSKPNTAQTPQTPQNLQSQQSSRQPPAAQPSQKSQQNVYQPPPQAAQSISNHSQFQFNQQSQPAIKKPLPQTYDQPYSTATQNNSTQAQSQNQIKKPMPQPTAFQQGDSRPLNVAGSQKPQYGNQREAPSRQFEQPPQAQRPNQFEQPLQNQRPNQSNTQKVQEQQALPPRQMPSQTNQQRPPQGPLKGSIPPPMDGQSEDLYECPEGCGRSFNQRALEKHAKVCRKVFQEKRKVFDSAEQRQLEDENGALLKKPQPKKQPAGQQPPQSQQPQKQQQKQQGAAQGQGQGQGEKKPKWLAQSEAFRALIKQSKGVELTKEEKLAVKNAMDSTQDMVQCKFCNRKFNSETAKKHIPFCEQQAKKNQNKGKKK